MDKELTPEQQQEFDLLAKKFRHAAEAARSAMILFGADSDEYAHAEKIAGDLWERLQTLWKPRGQNTTKP